MIDRWGANLGTGKDRSIREIMNCEEETTGVPIPLVYRPRRQEDPASLVADPSFAQNGLGWTAQHTAIEVAISTAWKWMNRPITILSVITAACLSVTAFGQGKEIRVRADDVEKPATRLNKESEQDADSFTLIVLPDTQGYADIRHRETQKHWPELGDQRSCFLTQTDWIRKNKQKMNIVMTVHVGDITQTEHDEEWQIADTAFKTIDNHVPYVVCSGNHDMGYSPQRRKTSQSRKSRFSSYFPPSRFTKNPLYNPHFGKKKKQHFREEEKTENYYLFLNAGGMKFLILTLEFKPRDEALAWANSVVTEHPDYRTIVVTHSYLTRKKGQRSNVDDYLVEGNSGESIWEKFVSRHRNIFLVLSGHSMENLLTSKGEHENTVHQVQADYWYWDIPEIKAGSGYLRIMTFRPDKDMIDVQTYSPVQDKFLTRPKSKFSLDYVMHDKRK
ncbi:MAG: hypothetical protein ACI9R3_003754 [Verrucomicrobiales bacterium]|jgi:hypothetical protein